MNEILEPVQPAFAKSMPRMDLYVTIHKALRHFMADTLVQIGAMDTDDRADLQQGLDQLRSLLALLRGHVQHENGFVHPAIEARHPGGSGRIAGEHEEHLASIDALQCEADALASARTEQRAPLALRLYRHLALFIAENLQHMHIEETVHNPLLWANYSDAELLGMHAEIMAHVPPQEMAVVEHWIAPALSHAELAGMLASMQADMPPALFRDVLQRLRPRLNASRWAKLTAALNLPQPAAGNC